MPQAKDYIWGYHLKKRLKQRFSTLLKREEWKINSLINTTICQLINRSEIQGSYKNNSRFMFNIQEEHGYNDRYEFLLVEDVKLILVVRGTQGDRKSIRTALYSDPNLFQNKTKFSKKDKRIYRLGEVKSKRNVKALNEAEVMLDYMEDNNLDISDVKF